MNTLTLKLRTAWNAGREWLTDARRQALHAALGTLGLLGVTLGYITDGQSTAVLAAAGSVLVLAQGVLGLSRLTASDAARWLPTAGRALIYGAATTAGAAGVAFGLFAHEQVEGVLAVLNVGITVVSSFLAVVNVQTAPSDPAGVPLTRRAYRASLPKGTN